jgi:hypothetical protein
MRRYSPAQGVPALLTSSSISRRSCFISVWRSEMPAAVASVCDRAERGYEIIGNGGQPLSELVHSSQGCFAQICGRPGTGLVPGPRSRNDLAQLRLRFRDQLGDV